MKAQYVGDIGDFGKVLLLKHLSDCGFRIGINWILTPNDDGDDGVHRLYVDYTGRDCLCCCDEILYEGIIPLARQERDHRNIRDLEQLIRKHCPRVVFFSETYETASARPQFDAKAFLRLDTRHADLVFFDPDNGIDVNEGASVKHVYTEELMRYWKRGQSLLIYHHLGRNGSHEEQIDGLKAMIHEQFAMSVVYSYRLCRGTGRAYFLIVPTHLERKFRVGSILSIAPLVVTKSVWRRQAALCKRIHN